MTWACYRNKEVQGWHLCLNTSGNGSLWDVLALEWFLRPSHPPGSTTHRKSTGSIWKKHLMVTMCFNFSAKKSTGKQIKQPDQLLKSTPETTIHRGSQSHCRTKTIFIGGDRTAMTFPLKCINVLWCVKTHGLEEQCHWSISKYKNPSGLEKVQIRTC